MGLLPEARLKPSPTFNHVMLDLFGPYTVRGEVQKRTSGKAYGVMFTDLAMRAVHIEVVFGYDTSNFLMALSRFASLRSMDGQRKFTVIQVLNLWVHRESLRKPGKE